MWRWRNKSYKEIFSVSDPLLMLKAIQSANISRSLVEFMEKSEFESIEQAATSGFVPMDELNALGNVVAAIAPKKSLEIGLASGSTALTIMLSGGNNRHVAIDPYQTSYESQGIKQIEKAGLASRFKWINKQSCIAMPGLLLEHAATFDFVYIDGNHMFDHTLLEWFYADRLLKVGGVIGFDDCTWAMVKTVVNFVETNTSYRFVKPTERTYFCVKMEDDSRKWYDFKPFDVAWNASYERDIGYVRDLDQKRAAASN